MPASPVPILKSMPLENEAASEALGAALAPLLRRGDVVCLQGDLGAGKTTLARGLLRALAGDPGMDVPSPTFTLVEVYEFPALSVWHFDLYRLKQPEDAWELGLEQALGEAASVIEWPERLGALLPAQRLEVRLSTDGAGRRAELAGSAEWRDRLARLQ
ncbi:MAG: tRNA (adenosine(37)-N6)-threonylcarbamoyltransferase complex ATPase subunit type 1 TsaE [Reyranellaceae bacterium]